MNKFEIINEKSNESNKHIEELNEQLYWILVV